MDFRLAILLLAGCGGCTDSWVWLPAPDAEAKVLVLSYEQESGRRISAVDAQGPIQLPEVRAGSSIDALIYRRGLDELPFEAGDLDSSVGGCPLVSVVPPFTTARADTDLGEGAWSVVSVPELDRSLLELRVDDPEACLQPCDDFQVVSSMALPGSASDATFAVMLPTGRVLIGTYDNLVFVVDQDERSGAVSIETVPIDLSPNPYLRGAWVDDRGVLWMSGDGGRIFQGRLEAGRLRLDSITTSPSGPQYLRIGTGTVGRSLELIGLGVDGQLDRYTPEAGWQSLHTFAPRVPDASPKGGLARVGPAEWIAGWGFDDIVVRIRSGEVTLETLEGLGEGITAIAHIDGYGSLVGGGRTGRVYRRTQSQWVQIGDEGLGIEATVLFEHEGAFLVGGAGGFIRQYGEGFGYCDETQAAPLSIRHALRLHPADILFTTDSAEARRQSSLLSFVHVP